MTDEKIHELNIDGNLHGHRIDLALSVYFEDVSRSYIQKLIETGSVALNGKPCTVKRQKLAEGDVVTLSLPEPETLEVLAEDIPLSIVYEDEDLLVVDKAKGMVVHPAPGNETHTLVNAVLFHCRGSLSSINGVIRPGIVHRLDKDTSGLLMVAKNDIAHRGLADQLQAHSITRAYKAIVYNNFTEDQGTVDAPIGRDPKNRLRNAVTETGAKDAVTHYRVLERFGKFTLIEARLLTGRTHQIRVHMAHINHPLLGDPVYGPGRKVLSAETQMLHAWLLGFTHPRTGGYMEFQSELPAQFAAVLEKLRRGAGA